MQVKSESKRVWKFIIEREIEAPARFQAIQTHRAAMALLRQQVLLAAITPPMLSLLRDLLSCLRCKGLLKLHCLCLVNLSQSMWQAWHCKLLSIHTGDALLEDSACNLPNRAKQSKERERKQCTRHDVLLLLQGLFVEQLYNSGMVDEAEKEALLEPIEKNERLLLRKGALGRSPKIDEVLS